MSQSPEQRTDGRRPQQLRPFSVTWNPMGFALSSLVVHTGRTAVLCSVCLEDKVPRWRKGEGLGWLSAEYRLLPGSTPQRQSRELMKLSGRTQEIQRLIGRALRAAVDMKRLGENTIKLDCDVIQADGGTRTASITGACVALVDALTVMQERGLLKENPLKQMIASISVGIVKGVPVLDLDYLEDSSAETDMNVVMTDKGGFIEIQGTGEDGDFSSEELNAMIALAQAGIKSLLSAQKSALEAAA